MEILENMTNGSNSTLGPSVVELITFAAISWSIIVLIVILVPVAVFWCKNYMKEEHGDDWYESYEGHIDNPKRCWATVLGIGVIAALIATVLLVVGSVLSTQNGVSTGLSAEGITGRVLLIVTEVIVALLVWPLMVAIFALICCNDHGQDNEDDPTIYNCIGWWSPVLVCVIGCVFGTPLVIGVALLGWSSFEFGNGSNSTVTPGLHTAGVLLSSVGLGVPFLILVILVCFFCCSNAKERLEETWDDAKKWWDRRKQTKD